MIVMKHVGTQGSTTLTTANLVTAGQKISAQIEIANFVEQDP